MPQKLPFMIARFPAPAISGARGLANVTLKRYDSGHFQPYVESLFGTIVRDQLEFLQTALAPE